jgi:hypothetical protein
MNYKHHGYLHLIKLLFIIIFNKPPFFCMSFGIKWKWPPQSWNIYGLVLIIHWMDHSKVWFLTTQKTQAY